jgi:hypothetical protein
MKPAVRWPLLLTLIVKRPNQGVQVPKVSLGQLRQNLKVQEGQHQPEHTQITHVIRDLASVKVLPDVYMTPVKLLCARKIPHQTETLRAVMALLMSLLHAQVPDQVRPEMTQCVHIKGLRKIQNQEENPQV